MNALNRFPVKLSAILLVLVTVAGTATVSITTRIFRERQVEIDQRLNRNVAASMAEELAPFVSSQNGEIESVMHYMMVMNPAVEIYLLDGQGTIRAFFASPGPEVQLETVDIEPIRRFIRGDDLPILGDNPRRPARMHHFSAAPITIDSGQEGYLYVVLHSSGYDAATMELQDRYLFQALLTAVAITLPLVGILGFIVFFLTTRPLKHLTATVHAFGSGDRTARSTIATGDEIGELSRNFNDMADTIVATVDRLQQADRERRELIANISHDLRNPLATIQGYLETLRQKDDFLEPAQRRRYYDILLGATRSLPHLVEDLFELSHLDGPNAVPTMEQFSLAELVQDVAMQWQSRAEDLGVELIAEEPDNLVLVEGDVGMVERVLTNLIRNALAHTPEGGRIALSVTAAGNSVRVAIRDTGHGVAQKDQAHVFDRFYIGDASRTNSRNGSGLGLAICKRIVELHHGTIGLDSIPGSGATFHFTLPRAPGDVDGDSV